MGFIDGLKAKLKILASKVWADLVDTYERVKIILLAILAAIIFFEWQKLKAMWLVKSGQNEIKSDQKQDAKLAQLAQNASDQGDRIQQQANQLPNQEQPVGEDWYKKDKK
jgi:hypothetical protein